MSKMTDLFEKLKHMPRPELEAYLLTAKITGGLSTVVGVSSIFLTLMFTNWLSIVGTFIILHVVGDVAVGAQNIENHVRALLKTKFGDK